MIGELKSSASKSVYSWHFQVFKSRQISRRAHPVIRIRAYSFQAVWAQTILVCHAQSLELRLLELYSLTPATFPATGEFMTADLAVFDFFVRQVS